MSNLFLNIRRSGLTVFSLGCGQDSELGFFKIWDEDFQNSYIRNSLKSNYNTLVIVFSHTGREKRRPQGFQSDYLFTYEGLKYLQDFFDAHKDELPFQAYFFVLTHHSTTAILQDHGIRFITHYYSSEPFFSDKWASIIANYDRNHTIGMLQSRSRACTLNLKLVPIYKFLSAFIRVHFGFTKQKKKNLIAFAKYHQKIKMLIFFSAEETNRVHHCSPTCKTCPKYKRLSVNMCYPLIDYQLDRTRIQLEILDRGHPLFIPSACDICHFMTDLQLEFFRRFDQEPIAILIRLEQNKFRKFNYLPFLSKNKGVFGTMTVLQRVQRAYDKYKHLSDEEVKHKILSFSHCIRNSY